MKKLSSTTATLDVVEKIGMAVVGSVGIILFVSGFRFLSLLDSVVRFLTGGVCVYFSLAYFFFLEFHPWEYLCKWWGKSK